MERVTLKEYDAAKAAVLYGKEYKENLHLIPISCKIQVFGSLYTINDSQEERVLDKEKIMTELTGSLEKILKFAGCGNGFPPAPAGRKAV